MNLVEIIYNSKAGTVVNSKSLQVGTDGRMVNVSLTLCSSWLPYRSIQTTGLLCSNFMKIKEMYEPCATWNLDQYLYLQFNSHCMS